MHIIVGRALDDPWPDTPACPPESLEIIITEMSKDSWATAGRLKSDS
ncbi:4-oxalocrotonate tautomerase [Rhizobium freirei PRF 81]|uniref:4-oxalocrotonate tautomerase n=1 Tax=Rhizobium freirei PRF 81 TaxID=363754 RepID=N6V2B2_9HYPH|nr:4-oxalocrotonate tautomerase [Rhizobium freirei PRF 81]